MRPIAISAIDRGAAATKMLVDKLKRDGHEVRTFGDCSSAPVDYPEPAYQVAKSVADGQSDMGLLICGTGVGMSIAANKVKGTGRGRPRRVHRPDQPLAQQRQRPLPLGRPPRPEAHREDRRGLAGHPLRGRPTRPPGGQDQGHRGRERPGGRFGVEGSPSEGSPSSHFHGLRILAGNRHILCLERERVDSWSRRGRRSPMAVFQAFRSSLARAAIALLLFLPPRPNARPVHLAPAALRTRRRPPRRSATPRSPPGPQPRPVRPDRPVQHHPAGGVLDARPGQPGRAHAHRDRRPGLAVDRDTVYGSW